MNVIFPAPDMVDVFASALGDHMRCLLRLAAHRECLLALQDQERAPFTVPVARPWVVVIGDDPADPETSLGPQGFDTGSVSGLLQTAADISLISCEIKPAIYERAAALASIGLSSVVIETRPEHHEAWAAFAAIVARGKLRTTALVDQNWGA